MLMELAPERFGSLYRKASDSKFEWAVASARFAILITKS